jgi:hypothetical protein
LKKPTCDRFLPPSTTTSSGSRHQQSEARFPSAASITIASEWLRSRRKSQLATRYAFTRFAAKEILSQGEIVWGLFEIEGDYLTRNGHRSGKAFNIDCAIRWRVRDGKVVEHQSFFDTNALRLLEEAVP